MKKVEPEIAKSHGILFKPNPMSKMDDPIQKKIKKINNQDSLQPQRWGTFNKNSFNSPEINDKLWGQIQIWAIIL